MQNFYPYQFNYDHISNRKCMSRPVLSKVLILTLVLVLTALIVGVLVSRHYDSNSENVDGVIVTKYNGADKCLGMGSPLCLSNGTCTNLNGSYNCVCALGFEGRHCETNVNDCQAEDENELCFNGGTCVDGINNHSCACVDGYIGHMCQTPTCLATQKLTRQTMPTVTVTCGGLIEIPGFPARTSFLLDYKSNITHLKREKCLWSFSNLNSGGSYFVTRMRVRLLCDGFVNSGRALSVVDWKYKNGDWFLSSNQLRKKSESYASTYEDRKLFLSYTSNSTMSSAPGFLLQVDILHTERKNSGTNFVYLTSPGNGTYGPFRQSYDYFSIVINPQQSNTTLKVHYLDTKDKLSGSCNRFDTLDIYEIYSNRQPKRLVRMCTSFESPISYISEYPFLATFHTLEATGGRGFQLSWK